MIVSQRHSMQGFAKFLSGDWAYLFNIPFQAIKLILVLSAHKVFHIEQQNKLR